MSRDDRAGRRSFGYLPQRGLGRGLIGLDMAAGHHALPPAAMADVRGHLDTCEPCWQRWNRYRWDAAAGTALQEQMRAFLGSAFMPYLDSSRALAARWRQAAPSSEDGDPPPPAPRRHPSRLRSIRPARQSHCVRWPAHVLAPALHQRPASLMLAGPLPGGAVSSRGRDLPEPARPGDRQGVEEVGPGGLDSSPEMLNQLSIWDASLTPGDISLYPRILERKADAAPVIIVRKLPGTF